MKKHILKLGFFGAFLGALIFVGTAQIPTILPVSPVTENMTFEKNVTVRGTLATSGPVAFSGLLTLSGKIDADYVESTAAATGTRYYDHLVTVNTDPLGEINSGYYGINWTAGTNGVFTLNALEGVARSRGADEAGTFRGVYGRVYIDPAFSATARTSVGGEFSARAGFAGGEIAAENGTAFVGSRIWMAPWFTVGTIGNVNNFHGLWIYNEHTSADVTNAIFVSSAGGSFTNFLSFYDGAGNQVFKVDKTGKATASGLNLTKLLTFSAEYDDGNSGAADTIDWNEGGAHKSTLTAACTYTFTAPTSGVGRLQIKVIQGGVGSFTVTWPAEVKWQADTAPTLSTAVGSVDIITFWWDGTYYRGVASLGWTT